MQASPELPLRLGPSHRPPPTHGWSAAGRSRWLENGEEEKRDGQRTPAASDLPVAVDLSGRRRPGRGPPRAVDRFVQMQSRTNTQNINQTNFQAVKIDPKKKNQWRAARRRNQEMKRWEESKTSPSPSASSARAASTPTSCSAGGGATPSVPFPSSCRAGAVPRLRRRRSTVLRRPRAGAWPAAACRRCA